MKNYVLILGAQSDVGLELAKIYAKKGHNLYLASRNKSRLNSFISNISIKYNIKVYNLEFDILNYKNYSVFFNKLKFKPEGVIICIGYLGNKNNDIYEITETKKIIETNFLGPVNILNMFARYFEKRKSGWIVGISSVAGERGRANNLIYSCAKSGFTSYLSGLRNRLFNKNVHVLTVLPGYIETKMTAGMNLPKFLTSKPKHIALAIYKSQIERKNILFYKPIWKFIMIVFKIIPENIFKSRNF